MTERNVALITGVTGQDGSDLSELLLDKGYEVHGIMRRSSNFNTERVDQIYVDPHWSNASFKLHFGDLCDANNLRQILDEVQPTEVFKLGAQSHVRVSFDMPLYTADSVAMGSLRILGSSVRWPSPPRTSTTTTSSSSTRATCARPRSTCSSATPRRPSVSSAGSRRSSYPSWSG